jgi:aspartyl-tRNA(Asn)/glutamyl-tRNA(Gln) amidotransferase subunit A
MIINEYNRIFDSYDIILTPTSPTLPFRFGERLNDPIAMYLSDILTVGANLNGSPAISIPFTKDGAFPIGIQLMSRPGSDRALLDLAEKWEMSIANSKE